MFEKFTERARKAVVEAQNEARQLRHNYIGTEHLLLGLIAEDEGIAAIVLKSYGLTLNNARARVENIVSKGAEGTAGQAPFTPRAQKALELALREALLLGHNYIGTEHMLLGLLREKEGVAARVLSSRRPDYADLLKRAVVVQLGGKRSEREVKEEPSIPEADILAHKVALYALLARERDSVAPPHNNSPAYHAAWAWHRFYELPDNWTTLLDEYQKEIRGEGST